MACELASHAPQHCSANWTQCKSFIALAQGEFARSVEGDLLSVDEGGKLGYGGNSRNMCSVLTRNLFLDS